ncbi:MAG: efflux RND transporter periplasmic adaptor subunit [Solirubrobacteraceae bacterium]
MSRRTARPWPSYLLGILVIAAAIGAYLVVGPPSATSSPTSRIITAQKGVVQSTVSASGNVQSASQLELGFKTSGVINHVYVSAGQHVHVGQLLATLNPETAEVVLQQAKATLQSAEAALLTEEEGGGEGKGEASSTGHLSGAAGASGASGASNATRPTTPRQSAVTRAAKLASARAQVRSDELIVKSDEQSVQDTKLHAPESGTIVSLSDAAGEAVSGPGTARASSVAVASSSSTSSGSSAKGSGAGSTLQSSPSTSSSSFAVLSDLSSLELVVPLSESEIASVKVGQPATATIEALHSAKLAAEVVNVATLPTTSGGVVSYDVTFRLDQIASRLRLGMSATAEAVTAQAEGVNVPTAAIRGGSVTVLRNGHDVRHAVTTGLEGNTSTIILSGLSVGEEVVIPIATTSPSSSALSGRLAKRRGGGASGRGGAAGGFAGGGGRFFGGGSAGGG